MIVDSHMHVWSMKDVDYYNDKDMTAAHLW